ncbi:MAG: DUF58 domain-containing protein [Planctomycetes bacterium]|jgi:uncharacterized protein (DUF58 family)|nr:DUF58 domain-containing protein [Planctomycetota bacterium]
MAQNRTTSRKLRGERVRRFIALLPVPTRWGWYFVSASAGMYFAAAHTGEHAFILLGALPLSLLIINALLVWASLRKIEIKRKMPGAAHAGESIEIELLVHNRKRWLPCFALEVEDTQLPDLGRDIGRQLVMAITPGYVARATTSASFRRRGQQRLREIRISTAFPFGLFTLSRVLAFRSEIVVYPRPIRLSRALEERLMDNARYFGESASAHRGEEEVFGVREYRPGENVKRIHWRTSARAAKPMILEMEGRRDASFVIVLNTAPVGDPNTLRERLEALVGLCAGLTYFLTRQSLHFRFAHFGQDLLVTRPGRGDAQYHALMERLAHVGLSDIAFADWVDQAGLGAAQEVPIVLTLGPKEHAEARVPAGLNAIVIGAADADFRENLSFDILGRRSVTTAELAPIKSEEAAP